ncbi:MAG: dsbB [Rhodospirillaceae bacterium]|nr:MAG: dsbB [Rhodospirillaceae bacterium]
MVPPHRTIPAAILGISVTALGGSLVMQFGLDLEPCILCLYQRLPYGAAAVLAVVALFLPAPWRRAVVAVCGAAFGMNSALAFYHVGVEGYWWEAATCLSDAGTALSLADMHAALEHPVAVPCDVVQWALFGLSLSGYNGVLSLGLAALCLGAAGRASWWRRFRHA